MGTYVCISKGCQHGGVFSMDAKEEEWHMDRFGHLPKACKGCRNWRKAQTDYTYSCAACYAKRTVPKTKIIGHHKYVGPWESPTLCRLCQNDPDRETRKRVSNAAYTMLTTHYYGNGNHPRSYLLENSRGQWLGRNGRRKLLNARQYIKSWSNVSQAMSGVSSDAHIANELRAMNEQWGISAVKMAEPSVAFYSQIPNTKGGGGSQIKHITDHDSLRDQPPQVVLTELTRVAESTDSTRMLEFRDGNSGYLIKVDVDDGLVTVIHDQKRAKDGPTPPPPPAYLISGFKNPDVLRYVGRKVAGTSDGSLWVPNVRR